MELLPLDTSAQLNLVAGWLSQKRIYQWLDFGNGPQPLHPAFLKIMVQKPEHVLRLFTDDQDHLPIGIVGLSNVNRSCGTAMLWEVLGERRYSLKGYARRAAAAMLSLGFRDAGLKAINAWAVESNYASLRILRSLGFKPIGRQRQCHCFDGHTYDHLWFDLLAAEHLEFNHA